MIECVVGDGIFAGLGRFGKAIIEARSKIARFLVTAHAFQVRSSALKVAERRNIVDDEMWSWQ
eukprot:1283043-Rhodomonas_salina.1